MMRLLLGWCFRFHRTSLVPLVSILMNSTATRPASPTLANALPYLVGHIHALRQCRTFRAKSHHCRLGGHVAADGDLSLLLVAVAAARKNIRQTQPNAGRGERTGVTLAAGLAGSGIMYVFKVAWGQSEMERRAFAQLPLGPDLATMFV